MDDCFFMFYWRKSFISGEYLLKRGGVFLPGSEKEKIVKIWFTEVFMNGDLEAVDTVAAKNMVVHSQGNHEGSAGTDNFKNWLKWYCESFADRRWVVNDMIEEGDK